MTSSTYQGAMISARSRRLRIVFSLLLVALLGMGIYGARVLMPAIQKRAEQVRHIPVQTAPAGITSTVQGSEALSASPPLRHLLRVQILFSYAYWTVWFLLFLSLLLVAWLDLREVTRNYTEQRRKIWADPALEWPKKRRPPVYAEDADRTTRISVDEESESKEE